MAKRITGVSARLLDCARAEFLEKGFQGASIREIAKKADTSPRAVYTRFPNKEGLFDAIVGPPAGELIELYRSFGAAFWAAYQAAPDTPPSASDPGAIYTEMMDFIYDRRNEFSLMIKCLDGTRYTGLIDALTDINCEHLDAFLAPQKERIENYEVMRKILRMLTCSFYAAMFEPLIFGMSREDARVYIEKLCSFFTCGIRGLGLS